MCLNVICRRRPESTSDGYGSLPLHPGELVGCPNRARAPLGSWGGLNRCEPYVRCIGCLWDGYRFVESSEKRGREPCSVSRYPLEKGDPFGGFGNGVVDMQLPPELLIEDDTQELVGYSRGDSGLQNAQRVPLYIFLSGEID